MYGDAHTYEPFRKYFNGMISVDNWVGIPLEAWLDINFVI